MKKIILVSILFLTTSIDLFSMSCFSCCRKKTYPVHEAIKANDLKTLTSLINQRVNLNAPDASGQTPVQLAANLDRVRCLKTLVTEALVKTKRIHLDAGTGDTALALAVQNKCVENVKKLVHAGADRSRVPQADVDAALRSKHYEIYILMTLGKCTEQDIEQLRKADAAADQALEEERRLRGKREERERIKAEAKAAAERRNRRDAEAKAEANINPAFRGYHGGHSTYNGGWARWD